MNYPIPVNPEEIVALRQEQVDEELVAAAIAGVVLITRSEGRSLADLTTEVLKDDSLLDAAQRRWLSDIVAQAWESLP
ncbi:MAG: hypothetical protein KME12_08585 [Trichocoleus desertorum ATA4-8-CV12]|jgi:hypothetical protein|uniref:hypothetical protein n=1 Tax=Trichocoleus desertorum TaxID=1481672 RepID=UPI0025B41464|nr:hypothetical protein [Trichocoleus desertorum]MBW4487832.1 hypothetical protein [Trichocoleus desertorum ATA4-8-CV12]